MGDNLSAKDIEKAKYHFSIYDFEGKNEVDAYNLGDLLRSLKLTPTQKLVEKLGGAKQRKTKMLKVDEFLAIYKDAKKDTDVGNMDDYLECLKLYDKDNNDTMVKAELFHILQALGEGMSKYEAEEIMKDCCEAEDEDGFVPFKSFLKSLWAGPYPDFPDL